MITRAKLVCTAVEETFDDSTAARKTGEKVSFQAVYNTDDSKEDNSYSAATPWANAFLSITNPKVFKQFKEGKAYYFDISSKKKESEEAITEHNANVIADFMKHCKLEGYELPDSVFESYFNA